MKKSKLHCDTFFEYYNNFLYDSKFKYSSIAYGEQTWKYDPVYVKPFQLYKWLAISIYVHIQKRNDKKKWKINLKDQPDIHGTQSMSCGPSVWS